MISPTGLGIRVDSEGDGNYGASRGTRLHNGLDYVCSKYQDIIAPFNMIITRGAYPKAYKVMQGIAWQKGKSKGRMFYFIPDPELIGKSVHAGDVIGVAQDVSEYYGLPNMANHIHFQINR